MTLKESVLKALEERGIWSTSRELFEYMQQNGYDTGHSKTPQDSVSATLSGAHNWNHILIYRSRENGAGEYGFPEWVDRQCSPVNSSVQSPNREEIKERDLHQLLSNYLWSKEEFPKTIYQERSNRSESTQKWIHPDIVSASFANVRKQSTQDLLKALKSDDALTINSYELKIHINNDYELKQAFFQALSNSSWANYGYLVAFNISDDMELQGEMERLSRSFGIGIIQLGVFPEETKVLFPARKNELDYKTIDKLCNVNEDFDAFIIQVTKYVKADKAYLADVKRGLKEICDRQMEDQSAIEIYCEEKNIIRQ